MSSTDRMRKLRERLKNDVERRKLHLEKERQRDKIRRELVKKSISNSGRKLKLKRLQDSERQRRCRQRKKEEPDNEAPKLGSYSCPQSLGKAVNRLRRALPRSPGKKVAVIRKLVHDTPGVSKYLIVNKSEQKRSTSCDEICQLTVAQFYCRDDVSRQAPGIKDAISIKDSETGVRSSVQKRHMLITVKEAFSFFQTEFPEIKIKRSKFHELRPKHVLLCSQTPHNVCICRYHSNMSYLVEAINKKVKTFPGTSNELLKNACCDFLNEHCATGMCEVCANDILLPSDCNVDSIITWKQWGECENRPKLLEFEGSLEDAVNELNVQLPTFKIHAYVKKVQSKSFEECKLNAQENHIIIQVDFAENYLASSQDEIQSAHWAHAQVTLFTCCAWVKNKTRSIVIVSDDLTHDKCSVWVYLREIFALLKKDFEHLKKVTVFSDGCAAQFKNKFTLSNLCFMNLDFGVEGEWVFFATSHGKGAVDGIGGCVKRLVWNGVKARKFFVNSAEEFFECAKTVVETVDIVYVSSQKIADSREMLRERWENVRPIPALQSKHFFKVNTGNSLLVGRTSTSKLDICQVFKSKIEDVYTDSDSDVPEMEVNSGELSHQDPNTSDLCVGVSQEKFELNDFVLVKFTSKKAKKYFIGQIEGKEDSEFQITFLRKKSDSRIFFFPQPSDICLVSASDIVMKLPKPSLGLPGGTFRAVSTISFTVDLSKYNIG